jgi:hypothetical protein
MVTAATALVVFDGKDVADAPAPDEEVTGYLLVTCEVCGTERDPRYPYCCELGAVAALEPLLATV